MGAEIEAAGDIATGAVLAGTVEGATNAGGHGGDGDGHHGPCANCGAALTGPYCAQCGQAAHIHRSLHSLGHDILHGVFHFEGKIWRTLPELALRPGRLTRRYIVGERAKFVSPMALFLFTVFLTFAIFPYTAGTFVGMDGVPAGTDWRSEVRAEMAGKDAEIRRLEKQRAEPGISAERSAKLDARMADRKQEREAMTAVAEGDWAKLAEIGRQREKTTRADASFTFNTGWKSFDDLMNKGAKKANENPQLLLYKLKTSSYKYSWALIPLSIPFLWLMFFWRFDIKLYDHAIFATYSISFMMMLMILLSILSAIGVPVAIWGFALTFVPPLHMYKQLRSAYGPTSRAITLFRLCFLLVSVTFVLMMFGMMLAALGVMG